MPPKPPPRTMMRVGVSMVAWMRASVKWIRRAMIGGRRAVGALTWDAEGSVLGRGPGQGELFLTVLRHPHGAAERLPFTGGADDVLAGRQRGEKHRAVRLHVEH